MGNHCPSHKCKCRNKKALNTDDSTTLDTAIGNKDLKTTVDLLLRGFDANYCDANGETMLSLAIKKKSVDLLKALIVFGASVNETTKEGHTLRHIAGHITDTKQTEALVYYLTRVGADRCPEGTKNCTKWCVYNGVDQWKTVTQIPVVPLTTLSPSNSVSTGAKILCLDGGGIRGLVETEVLIALEAEIQKIDNSKSLVSCFDWIGGTSSGGILTAGLVYKNKTPKELRSMLFELKDKVFSGWGGPLLHGEANAEALEKILQDQLGKDTKMSAVIQPKVVITSTIGDEIPPPFHCFTNYITPDTDEKTDGKGNKELPLTNPADQDVWKVARATSAAPGYFKMAFDLYLDGGMAANNPTTAVLGEYRKFQEQTGSQDTERDDLAIERAKTMCAGAEAAYYRLEPSLNTNVGLAETKDDSIIHMLYETHCYISDNKAGFKALAKILVGDDANRIGQVLNSTEQTEIGYIDSRF